jgi:arsenate reductase (glutaredoxin)
VILPERIEVVEESGDGHFRASGVNSEQVLAKLEVMASQPVILYHNPTCGTSRNVLGLIRERGIEPQIIEYLKTPPTRAQLTELIRRSGLSVRDFLRTREKLYAALDLANPKWSDDQLIDFLAEHPALLNRPVVETTKGVRPCRPAETVLGLLD